MRNAPSLEEAPHVVRIGGTTNANEADLKPRGPFASEVRERLKQLKREVREVTRANEILRKASASFAAAAFEEQCYRTQAASAERLALNSPSFLRTRRTSVKNSANEADI